MSNECTSCSNRRHSGLHWCSWWTTNPFEGPEPLETCSGYAGPPIKDPEFVPPTEAEVCDLSLQILIAHGLEDKGIEEIEKLIESLKAAEATDD